MRLSRPLSVAFALTAWVAHAGARETWQEMPPLPRGVAGHAAAATNESVWSVGGSFWEGDAKRIETSGLRHRTDSRRWERVDQPEEPPRPVNAAGFAHGGYASDGCSLWLVAGLDGRGVSGSVRQIDLATGTMREMARLPEPRVYCGAAWAGGALWIIGGTARDGDFARASRVGWKIDLHSPTRSVETFSTEGPPWINPLVLAFGDELHVLPGSEWSAERQGIEPPTHVWIFSRTQSQWQQRPLRTRLPRGLSGTTLDARRALVVGGVSMRDNQNVFADGAWIYHAGDSTFTAAPALPAPRLASAVARSGTHVFVLGGEDRARGRTSTVWRLPLSALAANTDRR